MVRAVKREVGSSSGANGNGAGVANSGGQGVIERRVLRSRYLAVKNLICGNSISWVSFCFAFCWVVLWLWMVDENSDVCADGREDMTRVGSDKFKLIIDEVESLHQQGIH